VSARHYGTRGNKIDGGATKQQARGFQMATEYESAAAAKAAATGAPAGGVPATADGAAATGKQGAMGGGSMADTVKFCKPVLYDNKEYESLTFDWGSLRGRDGLEIEMQMLKEGFAVLTPKYSVQYMLRLAARASAPKVGVDFFSLMPLQDWHRVREAAMDFLES
jgi:hypothetical protein